MALLAPRLGEALAASMAARTMFAIAVTAPIKRAMATMMPYASGKRGCRMLSAEGDVITSRSATWEYVVTSTGASRT